MVKLTRKRNFKRKSRRKSYRKKQKGGNPVKPHKFGIMCIFKNEAMGIREWIEHYLWQGLDTILLLDNDSTDNWKESIKGLEDKVTVLPAPGKHKQNEHYNNIGMPWLKEQGVTILAILDMDEFMFVKDGRRLKDLVLDIFGGESPPSKFTCRWTMFGSSGLEKQPESIRKSFIKRKKEIDVNIKSVFLLDKVVNNTVDLHTTNVSGNTIECPPGIQLNHYAIQSKEYFEKVKMARGDATSPISDNVRNWDYFKKYDFKDVDDTILRDLLIQHKVGGNQDGLVKSEKFIERTKKDGPTTIEGLPLDIYRIWHTDMIPTGMKDEIDRSIKMTPEFNNYLYTEDDGFKFIQENFDKKVADAYKCLKPIAYKADLWRYCILYIKGGVYIDIKLEIMQPLLDIIKKYPTIFVKEPQPGINNGFIVTPPKNPILKACIDEIVINCKNRDYKMTSPESKDTAPLDITGPFLLYRKVKESPDSEKLLAQPFTYNNNKGSYNDTLLYKEYDGYRVDQIKIQKTPHYRDMHAQESVYNPDIIINS